MRYVISHKIKGEIVDEITRVVDEVEMYAKFIKDEKSLMVGWVDIFDCDKFDTLAEAEMQLDRMPFNHTIIKIKEEV